MSDSTESNAGTNGFSGVTRNVLERVPVPGTGKELIVAEVTYPPGGVAPIHSHPVDGVVYIVEGMAESAYGSDAPQRYVAGQTFQDKADAVHTHFRNCDLDKPLRFLTTYVLEPGQPYTIESSP